MNSVHSTSTDVPTGAFTRLGFWVARRRWPVLIGYLITLAIFAGVGLGVFSALQTQGYDDPNSSSARASAVLKKTFGYTNPDIILAIKTPNGVDADSAAAKQLLSRVATTPGVRDVVSYWSTGAPQLRGTDNQTGQAFVYTDDNIDADKLSTRFINDFDGQQGNLVVSLSGADIIGNAFTSTISKDLARAESIAIPLTTLLLMFVFGSLVAAGLPFLVAAGTILGTFTTLFLITRFTDVSVFALNLVTGLGLALGIDYALLIISRFREELRKGRDVPEAVGVTIGTAGRTVFISGVTVAASLAALLMYPQYFLRSFAYAGISLSLLAVGCALFALPALLAILGPNVNRFKLRRSAITPKEDGTWARIARLVMGKPWRVITVTSALLLVAASPALGAVFGQLDERALPASNSVAKAGELLRTQFPDTGGASFDIVLRNPGARSEVAQYAKVISELPDMRSVTTPESIFTAGKVISANTDSGTWTSDDFIRLHAVSSVRAIDPASAELATKIRGVNAPATEVLVGGIAARWADATTGVLDRTWLVALWLTLTTLVIFFLFTGSVLIPIKALALNFLSLAATLGALVWVFQNNHLTWLTGSYTPTGTLDLNTLTLVGVVAFALSMDYEVFMIARIKEEHDAGHDTQSAVAFGLQRTAGIISAAAILIAIVFASFLTSSTTNIKQLGFGVTFAILIDSVIVRALLVPAFMSIAGRANWWAPAPLRRLHARIGIRES